MIGSIIIKLIGPLTKVFFPKIEKKIAESRQEIIEHIFKVGKLEENTRYREMPNELDRGLEKVKVELEMIKDQVRDATNGNNKLKINVGKLKDDINSLKKSMDKVKKLRSL